MVRNFDITFVKDNGIAMLQVAEFMNFMECYQYMKRVFSDATLKERLDGMRVLLISKPNYDLLMTHYSFDDYQQFYDKELSGLPTPQIDGISFDEPQIIDAEEAEKREEYQEEMYEDEE